MSEVLADYLRRRYRPSVARSYGNHVRQYTETVREPERALYTDVLAYVELLRGRGLHAKSLRNHLTAIKAYYAWLQEEGVREDHPCARLRLRDPVDRRVQLDGLYSSEVLSEWLAGEWLEEGLRDRRRQVAAGLLVHQALLSGELVRLDVSDVDLEAGTVYVTGGGKTASRQLALKASQVLELDAYIRGERRRLRKLGPADGPHGSKSNRLLLTNTGRAVHTATLQKLVNVGLDRSAWLSPLRIRQSVIARLLEDGHDVRVVQAFAGHATATATEQYKRSGLEELAAAVRKLHPRG